MKPMNALKNIYSNPNLAALAGGHEANVRNLHHSGSAAKSISERNA
jgi:hypothetical protein